MNAIIEQANKDLAGIFKVCWHEMDNGEWISVSQPCDDEHCIHCGASNLCASRPDFRKIVDVECKECEGSGVQGACMDSDCPGFDKPARDCVGCLPVCSHCNGIGSRLITKLQAHAERDNTWEKFLWSLAYLKSALNSLLLLTDINQLLIKYRDWRQKHEAQKA